MKIRRTLITIASVTIIIFTLVLAILSLNSCGNMAIIDTAFRFDKAIIFLPDGKKIEGSVEKWIDFESSDMMQVKIDGKWYLTHSTNVILIKEDK